MEAAVPLLPVPGAALRAALGFPQQGTSSTTVRGVARPAPSPLRAFLPPCQAAQCRAAGLLRPGPASLRTSRTAAAVWPPARAMGRARRRAGGPRSQALRVSGPGGARACRTRRWRGQVDRVVATCPHAPRASLRSQGRSSGLLLAGLCAAGHRWRARAPSPDRQPWQRGPWRWPAPGSRTRLPIAAALFLPPQDAQCNPGGATSRAGLATLGAPAHP